MCLLSVLNIRLGMTTQICVFAICLICFKFCYFWQWILQFPKICLLIKQRMLAIFEVYGRSQYMYSIFYFFFLPPRISFLFSFAYIKHTFKHVPSILLSHFLIESLCLEESLRKSLLKLLICLKVYCLFLASSKRQHFCLLI
jgi:hypothetical protein